ncbi:MAG TPA: hypothetical protein VN604_09240 [Nitrospirota bacterium]|nr:hypothetical protein [Nitrospirota bacterium]
MKSSSQAVFRKWSLGVLLVIMSVVVPVALINCIVDSYGILRSDFTKQFQEPNNNFIKIKFLLKNKDRYDSFLFGSSRVNGIDVEKIRSQRFYNMQYSEGVPKEHLDNIRFLLRSGVEMRTVLIGLDDFSYRVDPRNHLSDLMRQPHPDVSGKSWITFYGEYFLKIKRIAPSVKAYVLLNFMGVRDEFGKIIVHDILDSGRILCGNCDDEVERDPEKHRQDPKFTFPFHYDGDNIAGTLDSIRELVRLSREYAFRLVFFINPIHQTTYRDTDMELMLRFKKELAQITEFYDFSGLNTITTDNYYYHETSHYREKVGDMMLSRMFGQPDVDTPADFGILVSRKNIERHLAMMRRQLSGTPGNATRQTSGKRGKLPVSHLVARTGA